MKKTLFFIAFATTSALSAQYWRLAGNSSTNPLTHYLGTADAKDLVFKTNNSERLRINSTGNIGIGITPSSVHALKVFGRTQFIADVNSDGFYIGNHSTNVDSGNSLLFLRYGAYQPSNPGVIDVSGFTSPTKYEGFFSLKANGKLGLGTLTVDCAQCIGYRLFVKDGIKTEKVKVDIAAENGWADYVFNKDYKLMTLSDLDQYIQTKGHLPEVPTTEEAIANGIELKEMNILLLKKIEELTLHMIEQNKRIDELEKSKN